MVFDRFKSWRQGESQGVTCPSCQHNNPEGTTICIRCYYQLDRPSFEQSSGLDDGTSSDLLDELMSEIEKQAIANEDMKPPSFSMDNMIVDVAQYGDNDEIILNKQPDSSSIPNPPPTIEEEEEYELSSEDAPRFVNKFEVPEGPEDLGEIEEIERKPIELVQPTAQTPDYVEVVSASEVPDTNGWPTSEATLVTDPADFDGDGVVDEYEAAFASPNSIIDEDQEPLPESRHRSFEFQAEDNEIVEEPDLSPDSVFELPSAPKNLPIPRLNAKPIPQQAEPPENDYAAPVLPPAPRLPQESANEPLATATPEAVGYWPWDQQEEWPQAEVKKQLKAALEAALERKIAEATVLLDEVGSHLGNRTSFVYPIVKLLMWIGRPNAAKKMIEAASSTYPNDPEITRAREKLIS